MLEEALHNHSRYWCEVQEETENYFDGVTTILDIEQDKEHTFSNTHILAGLYKMSQSKEHFHCFKDIITEDYDGTTSDVLLQYIVLGEVLYG
jgi:hypothetical protein